jgi:hypothetical protein
LIAIERFHPMISSNILPNILPKKFISLLSEKSLKKKTLVGTKDNSNGQNIIAI